MTETMFEMASVLKNTGRLVFIFYTIFVYSLMKKNSFDILCLKIKILLRHFYATDGHIFNEKLLDLPLLIAV